MRGVIRFFLIFFLCASNIVSLHFWAIMALFENPITPYLLSTFSIFMFEILQYFILAAVNQTETAILIKIRDAEVGDHWLKSLDHHIQTACIISK